MTERRDGYRLLSTALLVGFAAMGLEALYLATVLSVSVDEAWIVEGIRGLAENGTYAHRAGTGATTTGGAYTLIQLVVVMLSGASLTTMRWVSAGALGLLAWEIGRWARESGASRAGSLIAVAALAAVPGTVVLASAAFAATLATWLCLVGTRLLCNAATRGSRLAAGGVLGLAAATRLNLVLVLPALALAQLCIPKSRRIPWIDLAGVLFMGTLVFLAGYGLLLAFVPDIGSSVGQMVMSAGVDSWLLAPEQLQTRWSVGNALIPFPALVLATVAALWLLRRGDDNGPRSTVLVAFGWTLYVFWLVVAPHPHLRYLWPALVAFSVALGLALGRLFDAAGEYGSRRRIVEWTIGGLALCLVASGSLAGLRATMVRDMNLLTWEWRGLVDPALTPLDGSTQRHQIEISAAIRALPPGDLVGALGQGFALEVLSGRPIYPLLWVLRSNEGNRWVVTTPHLGRVLFAHPLGIEWLASHCSEVSRHGDYALCRVESPLPHSMRQFLRVRPHPVRRARRN